MNEINEFPNDFRRWQVVDIGPVERRQRGNHDVMWNYTLKTVIDGQPKTHPALVAASQFHRIPLRSIWRSKAREFVDTQTKWHVDFDNFEAKIVGLKYVDGKLTLSEKNIDQSQTPFLCISGLIEVSEYGFEHVPSPAIIPDMILIRTTEIIRWYLAKPTILAQYMFDFSQDGRANDKLFDSTKTFWDGNEYNLHSVVNLPNANVRTELGGRLGHPDYRRLLGAISNQGRADLANRIPCRPVCGLPNLGTNRWIANGDFYTVTVLSNSLETQKRCIGLSEILKDFTFPRLDWGTHSLNITNPTKVSSGAKKPAGTRHIPDALRVSDTPEITSGEEGGNLKRLKLSSDNVEYGFGSPKAGPNKYSAKADKSTRANLIPFPAQDEIKKFSALEGTGGGLDIGRIEDLGHGNATAAYQVAHFEEADIDRSQLDKINTKFTKTQITEVRFEIDKIPLHFKSFIDMLPLLTTVLDMEVNVANYDGTPIIGEAEMTLAQLPKEWGSIISTPRSPTDYRRGMAIRIQLLDNLKGPIFCWLFNIERRFKGEMGPQIYISEEHNLFTDDTINNIFHYRLTKGLDKKTRGWPSRATHDGQFSSFSIQHPKEGQFMANKAAEKIINSLIEVGYL